MSMLAAREFEALSNMLAGCEELDVCIPHSSREAARALGWAAGVAARRASLIVHRHAMRARGGSWVNYDRVCAEATVTWRAARSKP
jgi:hypothetical protein